MKECFNHYYCLCGNDDYRECHYCRKQSSFYKPHYICLDCCIGWKSKYELVLAKSVDGSQLHEIIPGPYENNFEGSRCSKCGNYGIEVGRDFRLPKQKDKKVWMALKSIKNKTNDVSSFSYYMKKQYTYNCGGDRNDNKPILYDTRIKKPSKK